MYLIKYLVITGVAVRLLQFWELLYKYNCPFCLAQSHCFICWGCMTLALKLWNTYAEFRANCTIVNARC